jgi:Coenzyme PQQ synthesis protein D (PqqD)
MSESNNGSEPISVPEDVLSRELDGEAVLLDLRSGHYFGLNSTGSRVWAGLKDGKEADDIAQALVDEFDVDFDRAVVDTRAFIAALFERGLIKRKTTA